MTITILKNEKSKKVMRTFLSKISNYDCWYTYLHLVFAIFIPLQYEGADVPVIHISR